MWTFYLLAPTMVNSIPMLSAQVCLLASAALWPNIDHLCWPASTDSGVVLHILYSALLEIRPNFIFAYLSKELALAEAGNYAL